MPKDKEQHIKQFEAGQYLNSLRKELGKSLRCVAEELGISYPYLSEIEKGLKIPSDTVIESIANYYKIDEDDLYDMYGKTPAHVMDKLEEHKELKRVISAVSKRKKLKDEEKEQYKNDLTRIYKHFLDSIDKS